VSGGVVGTVLNIATSAALFATGAWWAKAAIVVGSRLVGGYLQSRGASDGIEQERGISVNVASNVAAVPVVYGRTKVGVEIMDARLDTASENDEDLYLVCALAVGSEDGTGIEGVDQVLLDERPAINSAVFENELRTLEVTSTFTVDGSDRLEYGLHAGSDTQTVDAGLAAAFSSVYNANSAGRGIAYLTLLLKFAPEIYTGIPRVTAVVKGQKVYDPRGTPGWAWSDNPALCVLDYLTSQRYGAALLYSERDGGSRSEIDEQSFIDAANYCDELVSVPGGTQKRFTCNGRVDTDAPVVRNLQRLMTSCRGELIYQGGKVRLHIRQPTTPETIEITDDTILGDIEYWRGGVEAANTAVVAQFVDSANGWQPQNAVWPEPGQSNAFLANDAGFENPLELALPFTDDFHMAQQIGMVGLRESREDKGIGLKLKEVALQYQVGDVVRVTHARAGFDQAEFWVRQMILENDDSVRVVLQEYDVAAYSLDSLNTRDTLTSSSLPDPTTVEVPTNVAFLADSTTALETESGQFQPRGSLTWTRSPHPFLTHYEVQAKLTSEAVSAYRSVAADPLKADTQVFILGLADGVAVDVRIRAVNKIGVSSPWVELTNQPVSTQASSQPSTVDLEDADISGVQDGHFIAWDTAGSPDAWRNRFIAAADVPGLDASKIASGILPTNRGGTGRDTFNGVGRVLVSTDASTLTTVAASSAGGFLRSNGSTWVRSTIQASDIPVGHVTQHQSALALAASQITSGAFADARISQSSVTQHQAALSIAESQIPDGSILARLAATETITGAWTFTNSITQSGTSPQYVYNESDAALNEKRWRIIASGGSLFFQGREDDGQPFANPTFMRFDRTGLVIDSITFGGDVAVTGDVSATADVISNTSDIRMKRDLQRIEGALAHLRTWRPSRYRYTDAGVAAGLPDGLRSGIMAQDFVGWADEVVRPAAHDAAMLNYDPKSAQAYIVAAIQELARDVDALRAKVGA